MRRWGGGEIGLKRFPHHPIPLTPYQKVLDVGDALKDEVRRNGSFFERLFVRNTGQDNACGNPGFLTHLNIRLQAVSDEDTIFGL